MRRLAILLALLCAPLAGAAPLSLNDDGVLLHNGAPVRAIGVNYYDAFVRTLEDPADTSYTEGFALLRERGIPFARLSITAFWAKGLALFRDDREAFLTRLDGVVRAAEANDIGLVPSFFWAYWTVPDLMGEPMRAWGKPDSKTHAFLKEFTRAVVSRYKDSPAIWMWEFGNEFNLAADLPEDPGMLPPVVPTQGSPEARTVEQDLLTTEDVRAAQAAFADAVRTIDPIRPITSGHAIPRPRAESLRATRGWGTLDTREAAARGFQIQHPEGISVASIHLYPESIHEERYQPGHHATYAELIAFYKVTGKPLFVGEFGAFAGQVPGIDTEEKALAEFRSLLKAIADSGVPLAAAWNFHGSPATGIQQQPWNFDAVTRSEYLDAIAEANERLKVRP